MLPPLPDRFAETTEALRQVACYVVAPARKAQVQRIGLVPVAGGFGTPPLDGGAALVVHGDRIGWWPGEDAPITTLRDVAAFAGVELSAEPGVGEDLPPFRPDDPLDIDAVASAALGAWYALGAGVLATLTRELSNGTIGAPQLWPEHFDLAAVCELDGGVAVNLGFSPGDSFHAEPYVYVGPHDMSTLTGGFWNAPFGAVLGYGAVASGADPALTALEFLRAGIDAVRASAT